MIGFFTRQSPYQIEYNYTGGQTTNQNRQGIFISSIGASHLSNEWDINNTDPSVTYTNNNAYLYKTNTNVATPRTASQYIVYINKTGASNVQKRARHVFYRPESVYMLYLYGAGLTTNANYYSMTGSVDLDYSRFQNLELLYIGEAWLPEFIKPFPNRLKEITINASNITYLPNLPENLRMFAATSSPNLISHVFTRISNNEATELESFRNSTFTYTNYLTLSGTVISAFTDTSFIVDLSSLSKLKELILQTVTVGGYKFPNLSNIQRFWVSGNLNTSIVSDVNLNEMLSQLTNECFYFNLSGYNLNSQSVSITDLKNIEYFNINRLKVTGNIDLSSPHPNLKSINIGDNTVANAPLRNLFTTVDLSGCSDLRVVNLVDCNIETLILPDLSKLERIFISNNILNDHTIDLTNSTELTHCYVGTGTVVNMGLNGTNFNIIGTENKTKLLAFWGSDTKLNQSLNFTGCSTITQIYASNSNLTGIVLPETNTLLTLNIQQNPNLTGFNRIPTSVTTLNAFSCDLTGNIDLPTVNVTTLSVYLNPKLTGFNNMPNSVTTLTAYGCNLTETLTLPNVSTTITIYNNPNLNTLTNIPSNLTTFSGYGCGFTSLPDINLTAATVTTFTTGDGVSLGQGTNGIGNLNFVTHGNFTNLYLNDSGITNLTFGVVARNITNFRIHNNPLTSIAFNSIIFIDAASNSIFHAYNTQLNIEFPLGTNIRSRSINISNNGMSQANVDSTINNLFNNRGVNNTATGPFNNTIAKSLNIAGNNAAPSGTYQQPAGFTHGLTDAQVTTAATTNNWSQKEKIWVLVNMNTAATGSTKRYKWSITYNS